MRTVSALDVRKHFGRLLDEASRGERLVIERAGQPVAALVPLGDLAQLDPERRRRERLLAIDEVRRVMPRLPTDLDAVEAIRRQRRERDEEIMRAARVRATDQE